MEAKQLSQSVPAQHLYESDSSVMIDATDVPHDGIPPTQVTTQPNSKFLGHGALIAGANRPIAETVPNLKPPEFESENFEKMRKFTSQKAEHEDEANSARCPPPLGHEPVKEARSSQIVPKQHVLEIGCSIDTCDFDYAGDCSLTSLPYMSLPTTPESDEDSMKGTFDFRSVFTVYKEKRARLKELFLASVQQCNYLDSSMVGASKLPRTPGTPGTPGSEPQLSSEWMAKEEQEAIESILVKNPTLVFFGQSNSGKSSIINQLLGKKVLEVAENPCQVGVIRLRFSTENYFNLRRSSDNMVMLKEPTKVDQNKGVDVQLSQFIKSLQNTKYYTAVCEDLDIYIEIGLRNSFLATGVELVDTPGIGQTSRDKFDRLMKQAADSLLQSVVYVIDGNRSISETDRGFLYRLRSSKPWLNIYYIVNKIDYDKLSVEMDMETDDEADPDELGRQIKQDKLTRVYNNLVRNELLTPDVQMADSRFFCGLSILEVRGETRGRFNSVGEQLPDSLQIGESTQAFLKMQRSFMDLGTNVLNSLFRRAVSTLFLVQKRLFDLFTEDNRASKAMQSDLEKNVKKKFETLGEVASGNQKQFRDILSNTLLANKEDMIIAATKMQFKPLKIGDYVRRNEMAIQCQEQIEDFILHKVNQLVESHSEELTKFKKSHL